jgi:multicomponent Na+:H+ antiporter subunit D
MGSGEAAIERALESHLWVSWLMHFGAIVTAAAVLRACGRIFLGWGPHERDAPGPETEDEEPPPAGPISASMWLPAAVLVALAFASTALPRDASLRTAARMLDSASWARQVIDQGPVEFPAAPAPEPEKPWPGIVSALLAVALAGATLHRKSLPRWARGAVGAVWLPLAGALRDLHTGDVSDQIAWLTLGAAVFGGCMLLLH